MKPQNRPLHIICNKEDIGEVVLMSGDPLRAKYIAEKYLSLHKRVNELRNMYAYTGFYKGKKITVMGHGMGVPSIGIYTFELFYYFDVKKIIRIGTGGAGLVPIDLNEVVLADSAYNESNYALEFTGEEAHISYPSKELNDKIIEISKKHNIKLNIGPVLTTDVFTPYGNVDETIKRLPKDFKYIAEEMESFALFYNAKVFKREAACLITIVDSKFTDKIVTPEDREKALDNMILLGLESLI